MTKKETNIFILITAALILLPMGLTTGDFRSVLQTFIPSVENFSAYPVWDYDQWSWGYGTAAGYDPNNKPKGTISKSRAFTDMMHVLNANYKYLAPLIKIKLNGNQWAALLSFSYNLGPYQADNLITNINSGNDAALFTQWRKYVYAGGVKSQGLINRREKEIALWSK
jgi:GH24 family phage-related lysozyme (muramidase)